MKIIKYKTKYDTSIVAYEVIKETEKQITYKYQYTDINGNKCVKRERENKISNWHHWHDSFDDAKYFLLNKAYYKMVNLEKEILNTEKEINIIDNLKDISNG